MSHRSHILGQILIWSILAALASLASASDYDPATKLTASVIESGAEFGYEIAVDCAREQGLDLPMLGRPGRGE